MEQEKRNIEISNKIIGNVFGRLDDNMRKIEKAFSVNIINRGDRMTIVGQNSSVNQAQRVIEKLMRIAESGEEITEQNVNYLIALNADEGFEEVEKINKDYICMTVSGRPIKPKTLGQKKYVDLMRKNNVVFGVGPAGTGKTYLAMAMAITAFKNNEVSRIILTRPAIEAGEKLGFLPGDLQQKVDPYLRPLYDALHEIMGTETFQKNLEKGAIEVAPLAYMRGRTLDNAYIVLDEAQNTTPEQMKMFLTRIGLGSKAVITGDLTQIDLPDGKKSGIVEAIKILTDIEGIGISHLSNKDVVRHPLVQKIIEAYEKYEEKSKKREALEMKKAATYKKIGRGMRSRRE